MDERFIIKQVTRTELESFVELTVLTDRFYERHISRPSKQGYIVGIQIQPKLNT